MLYLALKAGSQEVVNLIAKENAREGEGIVDLSWIWQDFLYLQDQNQHTEAEVERFVTLLVQAEIYPDLLSVAELIRRCSEGFLIKFVDNKCIPVQDSPDADCNLVDIAKEVGKKKLANKLLLCIKN